MLSIYQFSSNFVLHNKITAYIAQESVGIKQKK